MPDPVSSIPNLGPASEAAFAKAGIHSADEIRELGADESYMQSCRACLISSDLVFSSGFGLGRKVIGAGIGFSADNYEPVTVGGVTRGWPGKNCG